MKQCTKCGQLKELTEFNKQKASKDGLKTICKSCKKISNKNYREHNPDYSKVYYQDNKERIDKLSVLWHHNNKEILKDGALRKKYGITLQQRTIMSEEQGGRCKICNIEEKHSTRQALCVDHDHDTGAVRGLLCGRCNVGLGMFQDSSEFIIKAATYLQENGK
jgi:hypothetical protein